MSIDQTISLKAILDNKQALAAAREITKEMDRASAPRPAGQTAAVKKASSQAPSGTGETKTARSVGAAAGTGSAASDFAAQASGLGGLVHVYATFAANIFAVSAAFTALSKSMDVTNLVKGLDQIGASSGRNLGSLAKQMVAVADGAISMQQAMTSTAMASSGGLTNQAILRMTEVAKKASLALGRDMSDSMDRLTKGIVKTQPELLDELGIMTRMIPAQQEYARQIGKTIGSLTDFEKRQAFANAVLAEGEKKFGAINLNSNPYSKILASTQNLIQSGLELINKVLGPLMDMLSQSPTGLAVALGGIATLLLKQAMPAIGMFRENARKLQQDTHERLLRQVDEQQKAAMQADAEVAANREKVFREVDSRNMNLKVPVKFNKEVLGSDVRELVKKHPLDLTDEEIGRIKAKHASLNDSIATSAEARNKKQLGNFLDVHSKMYDAMKEAGNAAAEAGIASTTKWYSHEKQKAAELAQYRKKAAVSSVLANVADTVAIYGPKIAFSELRKQVDGLDVGKFTKFTTVAKGGLSIVSSAVGTAVNAFGMWGQVLALVGVGITILDGYLSTSGKQMAAYESAIDTLNSSFDNIDRTLDVIKKKDLKDFLSVESIQAKANALADLTGNLSSVIDKFIKLQISQSGWDKFFDGFWDMFGKGSGDKLALGISSSVIDALRVMEEGPAKEEAKKAIQNIVGQPIDTTNIKGFNAVIKDLDKTELGTIGTKIEKVLTEASRLSNNAAASLSAFKTALGEVDKQSTTLSNSLIPTDDFSKLGVSLSSAAATMATALQDPINGMVALKELSKDTRSLSFLPPDAAKKLGQYSDELDKVSVSLAQAQKDKAAAEEQIGLAKSKSSDAENNPFKYGLAKSYEITAEAKKTLIIEEKKLEYAKSREKLARSEASNITTEFKDTARLLAKAGYDNLALGLTKALSEAAVVSAKGYLDTIKTAGGFTAAADAELSKQQIKIQIQDIENRYNNTIALTDLTLEIQKNTLEQQRSIIMSDKREQKGVLTEDQTKQLAVLNKGIGEINLAQSVSKTGSTNIRSLSKAANSVGADDTLRNAMGMLANVVAQSFGKDSALAGLYANLKNADLQKRVGSLADKANIDKQTIGNEDKVLSVQATEITNLQTLNGLYNSQLQARKELISEQQLNNKFKLQEIDIDRDIGINNIALSDLNKKASLSANDIRAKKEAERNLVDLITKKEINRNSKVTEFNILNSKNLQDRSIGEAALATLQLEHIQKMRQYALDTKAAEDISLETKLTNLKNIGAITESEYITKLASLKAAADQRNFDNETSKAKEAQIIAENKIKDIITEQVRLKQSIVSNATNAGGGAIRVADRVAEGTAPINSTIEQQTGLLANSTAAYEASTISKQKNKDATAEATKIAAEYNAQLALEKDQMDSMQSITASLTTMFESMGTSLGTAAEAFAKMGQESVKYANSEKTRLDLLNASKDPTKTVEEQQSAVTKLNKLESTHVKTQVSGISQVAGATKKMFGEKTAAYKIMDGIEKASAAMKLALDLKEMAMDLKKFAMSIGLMEAEQTAEASGDSIRLARLATTEAAANTIKTPGIFASFMSAMGPWGAAAAAAAIAMFVGSAFGGGGGGDFVMPEGKTAESMRGMGAGQTVVDGKIVESTGGVFGDATAKSETLTKSLELLTATSVEGLSYSNEMVTLLTSINTNISAAASTLYGVKGVRAGSALGTIEGSSSNPGFLGLFASSSSTSIINSGIALSGTFADLTKKGNSLAQGFETVQTSSSSSGFFGIGARSSTDIKDKTFGLPPEVNDAITSVFSSAAELFVNQGKKLGQDEKTVMDTLANVNLSDKVTSLKGLKGDELDKELNSFLSSVVDTAAKALFPALDDFKKFGEGYAQTVIRVLDSSDKINQTFRSIGKTMTDLGDQIKNFSITEALAAAAGGLDKFLEKVSTFKDNFLSAAEQLAPKQKALTDQLTELSIPTGITTAQLKTLVLGYQVTNKETADYYIKLLDVSDGYTKVTKAMDEVASTYGLGIKNIEDLIKSVKDADAQNTGVSVAENVLYGIESAMYNQGITAVAQTIMDTVISPIITAASNGTIAAYLMSDAFTEATNSAVLMAQRIADAFNNPEVQQIIHSTAGLISGMITTIGNVMPSMPKLPTSSSTKDSTTSDYAKKVQDELDNLNKTLSDLKDQSLTPAALLEKQRAALLNDQNRAVFDQIQVEKELLKTKKDQQEFDQKYIDTLAAIHVGTAKTNAEYTKLATTFLTLDDASKLGLNISQVGEAFKKLDSDSIYKFIMSLGDISTITPAAKVGLLGIAQSLLTMSNALDQSKSSLEGKIYTAKGNSEAALAITRAAELAALDDSLKPRQEYLYALEDEASLKAKLKTAYDKEIGSMKDLISKLKDTSKTIKEYQNTLKMGDLSVLTPEQKYQEAKKQAGALASVIGDSTSTWDQKIEAANKLPAAADAVLTASKTLFASSSQYQDDYNTVQKYLSSVTDIIDNIVTPAEQQLAALDTANTKLAAIESSSSEILKELQTWPAKLEALRLASVASGSVASNVLGTKLPGADTSTISLSGPPVAVPDFSYTTSTASTQLLSNNKELILEIQKLRKEVEQLRTDQKEQTGHLIASNYDASTQGAAIVADATVEAANTSAYNDRNTVKLK